MDFSPEERSEIISDKLVNNVPMTFGELLDVLTSADEGLLSISIEEQQEVLAKAELKVDSYKFVEEKLKMEVERLRSRIEEFRRAKELIENNLVALKKLICFHMESKGFEKFPGVDYKVRVQKKKTIEITAEPTADLYMKHPDLIKCEFTWKKKEVEMALGEGRADDLKPFIAERETKYPVFTVNNDKTVKVKATEIKPTIESKETPTCVKRHWLPKSQDH